LTRNFTVSSFTCIFLLILLLLFPIQAIAGSFKVIPIKLFFDAKTSSAVLRLLNEGDEKVTVQLNAMIWSQDENGEDRYEPAKDIIFFPKIADIDKGGERIVRVGYQGPKSGTREKTYRLFLQELPVSKPGETALRLVLKLAVPIFIAPAKEIKERVIEKTELSSGRVLVKVKNGGNAHFIVSKIKAAGLDVSGAEVFSKEIGGWYVLAGAFRIFTIDIPEKECLKASLIKITAEAEGSGMDAQLNVNPVQCKKPEKSKEIEKDKQRKP
jgi:fimbrial chaperone protein